MKKLIRLTAVAFAAMLICGLVQPVGRAMAQTPNLSGTYTYDPGASQNIAAAIKKVTSQMFFGSGMATDRLTKTNQPPQQLVITQTASDITNQADNGQAIKTTMNGTPVSVTREDGEALQVSSVWQGTTLQRSFQAQDGLRVNSYSLDPSGKTLTMGVQLTAGRLPAPLTYQLVYRKAN
jgi:hypothetical protein